MAREFWRWKEYVWANPDVDWKRADVVTAGVDIGSVSSQCVILADGEICAVSSVRTGASSSGSAEKVFSLALDACGMDRKAIQFVVGTGYGRVNVPMADKTVTEIACHARGANYIFGPTVRTVIDIGGQDCKVIRVDQRGRVVSFVMNDRCAAGTGRGVEVVADLLRIPIEEVGKRSLQVDEEPPPVSSTCVVFAKSELLSLIRGGWSVERALAAYCLATARRIVSLVKKVGFEKDLAVTGGISKNEGVVRRLERELGVESLKPKKGLDPQTAGALGAALVAMDLAKRSL